MTCSTQRTSSFWRENSCIFPAACLDLRSMYSPVSTRDPAAVRREVLAAAEVMFPLCDRAFIEQGFAWVTDCFAGKYPGYQAIDANYHDFEHTLQGTLCMTRLLRARHE